MTSPSPADICSRLSHWAVLAAGALITTAATANDSAVRLLRKPAVRVGTVADGLATVRVPHWFPVGLSVLAMEHGEIYARVKDLAVPLQSTRIDAEVECVFDLRAAPMPLRSTSFKLTYSPWFRFLAEPIGFDAEGAMAAYVAQCARFLLVREGVGATVEQSHDACVVRCANGMTIEVEGMASLERIDIVAGGAASFMDFAEMEMQIDRRMFPQAFTMGHELLATTDRLANMELEESGSRLILRALAAGR